MVSVVHGRRRRPPPTTSEPHRRTNMGSIARGGTYDGRMYDATVKTYATTTMTEAHLRKGGKVAFRRDGDGEVLAEHVALINQQRADERGDLAAIAIGRRPARAGVVQGDPAQALQRRLGLGRSQTESPMLAERAQASLVEELLAARPSRPANKPNGMAPGAENVANQHRMTATSNSIKSVPFWINTNCSSMQPTKTWFRNTSDSASLAATRSEGRQRR